MEILNDLNAAQRQAAEHTEGPLLVLAGAGSGKTRVITYRIAYLVKVKKVPPDRILAVTFTNKAAGEMKSRVHSLIGASSNVHVGTFHSAALAFLRRYSEYTPYSDGFSVIDDRLPIVKAVMKDAELDPSLVPPKKYLKSISAYKNTFAYIEGQEPEEWMGEDFRKVFEGYSNALIAQRLIDFDDMLALCVRVLMNRADVLNEYRNCAEYILVDEYQDTNSVQFAFLSILAGPSGNLCVVGDDDQSIYAFRGAEISNILNFEKNFKNVREIKLTVNYRSTEAILSLANNLINRNHSRRGKNLLAAHGEKGNILFRSCKNEKDEAEFLAVKAFEWSSGGRNLSDMAVLYRTNAQSRSFEIALKRWNISYEVVGSTGFYQRREIKDILAYLRVLDNPFEEASFVRAIKTPPRGVGDQLIEKIKAYAIAEDCDLLTAASQTAFAVSKKQALGINLFLNIILDINSAPGIADKVKKAFETSAYREYLFTVETREDAAEREENVSELINAAVEFSEQFPGAELSDFLAVSTLSVSEDKKAAKNAVRLMTIHSAKGLEFDSVYITGLEEGIFPITSSQDGDIELEEERRLCYVAITRAKTFLTLTCAQSRITHGNRRNMSPSRFIAEMKSINREAGTPVFHEIFGDGFIMALSEEETPMADVLFLNGGRKRIRMDFLQLK
jgi:DNA helicase-2/ATP-dependent DNA helicase PcrA